MNVEKDSTIWVKENFQRSIVRLKRSILKIDFYYKLFKDFYVGVEHSA